MISAAFLLPSTLLNMKKIQLYSAAFLSVALFQACSTSTPQSEDSLEEAAHSKYAEANYLRAFPDDSVKLVTIVMTQSAWDSMFADMTSLCGAFGSGNVSCGGVAGNAMDMISETPTWVPCELKTDGQVWSHVGIRFKGNSSLSTAWSSGSKKLPLRLNMDKYEKEYPDIKDQRYWGFKRISLFNNSGDNTSIREKLAEELFRDAGVPAVHSALAKVILIHGDSTEDLGMYTMAEIPDKPLLTSYYSESSGNLYKPTSTLATFVDSEFSVESDSTNFLDVQNFIAVLQDSSRLANPTKWRAQLEAVFNVSGFLRWLAVNTVISNWDAYGQMAHNYYIYNNQGVLQWIPWDLGLAFAANSPGGGIGMDTTKGGFPPGFDTTGMDSTMRPPMDSLGMIDSSIVIGGGGFGQMTTSIWHEAATAARWPLIRYVMDDSVYKAEYVANMKEIIAGPASVTAFQAKVDKYGAQVAPYANTSSFSTDISTLRNYMATRIDSIKSQIQ